MQTYIVIAELSRAKRAQRSTMGKKMWSTTHPTKFGNRTPTDRPTVRTTEYQCKITQSTGMATQMQLEVILTGNRLATRVL